MYNKHFGLNERPFTIAPDPRYLYMSEQHREALAHLMYGIRSEGGFVLLTGEVGTGKTTVCRCFLDQVPAETNIAFILNSKLSAPELLAAICDELDIGYPEGIQSSKDFEDYLNVYLLEEHAKDRQTVLVIEEAQNLSVDVLEQIRLLTNLETNQRKLLQIIMIGQPELRDMLSKPELRQLSQRITARYHLEPLSKHEVAAYVEYRLSVAGASSQLFPYSTMGTLYRLSGGIPRLINAICDRALLGAYVQGQNAVDKKTLRQAASEVYGKDTPYLTRQKRIFWAGAGALILCGAVILSYLYSGRQPFLFGPPSDVAQHNVAEAGPERPRLDVLSWPESMPRTESQEIAFQSVFNQWGVAYQASINSTGCRYAETIGLRCLQRRGSLENLRQLNRPAVLRLHDSQGKEYFAALTALEGDTAGFVFNDEKRLVAIKDVADQWSGYYTLLWRMPPHYEGLINPGDTGPAVKWLDEQLALLQKRSPQIQPAYVYTENLVRDVKLFQLTEGLVPDGIVGPLTIIHLNTALGIKEPLLHSEHKEN